MEPVNFVNFRRRDPASTMPITLYGIPNCDTVTKARDWLKGQAIAYAFHDYKRAGLDADKLARWVERAGWEKILNRAGTTFRKLADGDKTDLDSGRAIALMIAHPSAIKRPIVEHGEDGLLVGFDIVTWSAALT